MGQEGHAVYLFINVGTVAVATKTINKQLGISKCT